MSPSHNATGPARVELLAEVLRESPALPNAACRGEVELFSADDDPGAVEAAIEICETCCRDMPRCRAWLDSLTPTQRPAGVVAGRVVNNPQPRKEQPK